MSIPVFMAEGTDQGMNICKKINILLIKPEQEMLEKRCLKTECESLLTLFELLLERFLLIACGART